MASAADIVRRFLEAIEKSAGVDEILAFYHADAEQIEYPNRLLPNGKVRDRMALREAILAGANAVSRQNCRIVSLSGNGNFTALEAVWTGTLRVALGALKAGDNMTAHFAQFFEFRDGLIYRQRNYDCFDPF